MSRGPGPNEGSTAVVSQPRVADDIQYGLDEGPCVSAVAEARTFTSGNLGGEAGWPRFGPRVGRLGVHSALSLPLLRPDGTALGALNVYAHRRNAFDAQAVRLGEAFAGRRPSVWPTPPCWPRPSDWWPSSDALGSRAEIDQALGIVMSRSGSTAEEAFDRLRQLSQGGQTKLLYVARDVIGQATRRARARHVGADGSGTPDAPVAGPHDD